MNVAGKRAPITGGSSAIGLAFGRALPAKTARVAISGRRVAVDAAAAQAPRGGDGDIHGNPADAAMASRRTAAFGQPLAALGGLEVLVNNAGGIRRARRRNACETEWLAPIDVDLAAPTLLTPAALPALRERGDAMVIDLFSNIAQVGTPFHTPHAAVNAAPAHSSEAPRRALSGAGVHILTVHPAATDARMMRSNRAGPRLGFTREPVAAVAEAIADGIETARIDLTRGGEGRSRPVARNRANPSAANHRFLNVNPKSSKAP